MSGVKRQQQTQNWRRDSPSGEEVSKIVYAQIKH